MEYVLRFAETGRDAQRGKLRRHLIERLRAALPDAHIDEAPGRLYLSTSADATTLLEAQHGLTSWSPAERCRLDELEQRFIAFARCRLDGAERIAVRVKRTGTHRFTSTELARRLGGALVAAAGVTIDLRAPERRFFVEVREGDVWLFAEVQRGLDERGSFQPTGEGRFIADQMLGTLATWLRMLGFDTLYSHDEADAALLERARAQSRVVLTRDRGLSRARSAPVIRLEARSASGQLRELLERLQLRVRRDALFSRCSLCNQPLVPVEKSSLAGRVPPRALARYHRFMRCPACDRVYWQGGHYDRIFSAIASFLD